MPVLRWLRDNFQADHHRLFYWLPVAMGVGVMHYFLQANEPNPWPYVAVLLLMGTASWRWRVLRPNDFFYVVSMLLAAMAAGVLVAQWQTLRLQTPFLAEATGVTRIEGTIHSIDRGEDSGRVVLGDISWLDDKPPKPVPRLIRLRVQKGIENLAVGQRIRTLASIQPPSLPVLPGGYDFARQLYFDGIGGIGFTLGAIEIVNAGASNDWADWIQARRDAIIQRVFRVLDGDQAAVAAALITSEDDGLSAAGRQDMRQSGLQHILSVSGLHLTLVGGLVFLLVRYLLLWSPQAMIMGKKIAAIAALIATLVYLVISGFAVPTQRAFLMVGLMFLAVLIDREALSLRLVALSAIVIIALRPDAVMGVSFQLSFAAVTALIAIYELWRLQPLRDLPWWRIGVRYFALSMATTMIATAATTPLVIYHFHQMTLQGALANALAAPLTSFWLMPMVVLTLFTLPLGLADGPIWLLGQGVDWLLALADWSASLPGAKIQIAATSALGTSIMVAGGLWVLLWQARWRWLGVPVLMLGVVLAPLQTLPQVLVNNRGNLYAVRDASGALWLSGERRDKFSAENWLNYFGQNEQRYWADWPDDGADAAVSLRCDSAACAYRVGERSISFAKTPAALAEDCGVAEVVITPLPASRCQSSVVVDQNFTRQHGAVALWVENDAWRWRSNRQERGYRPWSQVDWQSGGDDGDEVR